ncbi:Hypothetical_protein [Hexamita inflata]|uniref:Hypothetical_protein n=1 Tax=Hexamita inflata TaxID=28002 RepID=A0AA86P062_9EUKA|nr:Hypothetical protein HINF_LOCUS17014 [Hexamita inflata]
MVQASSGLQSSAKEVQNLGVQDPFQTFKLQIPMLRSQVSNADTAQKQERPLEQDAVQPLQEEKQQQGAKPSLVLTFEKPRYQEQSAITETFEEENREEVQDGTVDIDFLGEEPAHHLDPEKPEEHVQTTAEEVARVAPTQPEPKNEDAREPATAFKLQIPTLRTQSTDTTHNGTQPEETRAVEQSAPPRPEAKEQKAAKPCLVLNFEKPRYQEQSVLTDVLEDENRDEVQEGIVDLDFGHEDQQGTKDAPDAEEVNVQPMVQASSGLQSSAKEVQNLGVQDPFQTFKLQIPMLRSQVSNADTAQKQERPLEQDAVQPLQEEKQQQGAKPSLVLTFEKPRYQEQSAITETFEEENREEVQDGTVDIDFLGEEPAHHLDPEKPEEHVQTTAEEVARVAPTQPEPKNEDAREPATAFKLQIPTLRTQSTDTTHNGTQPEETRAVEQSAPPRPEAKEQNAGSVNSDMKPENQRVLETKNTLICLEGKEQLSLILNSNLSLANECLADEKVDTKIYGLEDKYNQLITNNSEAKYKSVLNEDQIDTVEQVLKQQKLIQNNSKSNLIIQSVLSDIQMDTVVPLKDNQNQLINPQAKELLILSSDEYMNTMEQIEQNLTKNNSKPNLICFEPINRNKYLTKHPQREITIDQKSGRERTVSFEFR